MVTKLQNKNPLKKAHHIGTSVVLTIDPIHVRRLQVDDWTFFEQKTVENGILLEKRTLKLSPGTSDEGFQDQGELKDE